MIKNPVSRFFSGPRPKAAWMMLVLFVLIGMGIWYFLASGKAVRLLTPQPENALKTEALLRNTGNGWWEAGDLIYHGIPARILFQMPPGTEKTPEEVNAAAWLEFERIGGIFNPFDPGSELARLNSLIQPQTVTVSNDFFTVMRLSRALWNDTGGNFDPTMWPVKQLWQAAEKTQQIPGDADIAAALKRTGMNNVKIMEGPEHTIAFSAQPVQFDFGGVVKGYAVDRVCKILLDAGITSGLVQLGGEVNAFGDNNAKPWRIGIQHPREMDKIWGVISSKGDIRVSTSGNYRQPIQIGDQSFYHIFSPETGWPVSEKVLGVTTADLKGVADSARLDGIATAITVMGPKNGLALAQELGIEAIILYEKPDGGIGEYVTQGLSGVYGQKPR